MAERRAATRFPLPQEIHCHVGLVMGKSSWSGTVHDLSRTGIGILMDAWLPPETLLAVEVDQVDPSAKRLLLTRACHATRHSFTKFLVGVKFGTELPMEHVTGLLGQLQGADRSVQEIESNPLP